MPEEYVNYARNVKLSGANPYNITIETDTNFTKLSFDSLIYKGNKNLMPRRYMLFNHVPDHCKNQKDVPYAVFLPGFGADPTMYGLGFPYVTELINNGTLCCFYAFMPYFFILPLGGYWYTNNANTVPENYLFLEVVSVIEAQFGDHVTKDPSRRLLMGHSMGGYGAMMNSMRTNFQYFGSVCALNGGLFVWNLPVFQNGVRDKVLNESIVRKDGPFQTCNYTQPPYRYYADELNFNTIVSASLAAVFHADGTTQPKPNSPWFSATLFNQDCTKYSQTRGFQYWLDDQGNLQTQLFNVAPWNSPAGFLDSHYPTLQESMNGNVFMSTTYEDDIVEVEENIAFSNALSLYNISHELYLYNGTHLDAVPGMQQCLIYFASKLCRTDPTPTPSDSITLPTWALGLISAVAILLLIVAGFLLFRGLKSSEYSSL
eukprot:TRINITY_DN10842_c0_g1_i1.p1 TRINITY_DN10842_c0_g1~~TRINITY_DN10842_c0_g1_i1.p1  ORF type:complete len:472 (+),score=100.17 TRINITY_DN10842_c0_g1_i1:129-1418(+)